MPFFKKRSTTVKVKKREIPQGLWIKCPACTELVYRTQLVESQWVCPKCGHHFELSRNDRINLFVEPDTFSEWDANLASVDVLGFTGTAPYLEKLERDIKKTAYLDAVTCGKGRMGTHTVGLGVMDFNFLGASMGSVVGEKITRLFERSTAERLPVVLSCASGGARMYEGMFSLMQMAKTSAAINRHGEAGLLYIAILTHPTMAGVMASFATLGDIIIAEPGALIGFAGPRVIKETTQQDLPEGFQTAEFLLQHGLLDMVVNRRELKSTVVTILNHLVNRGRKER